jgi:hypothetical protein
MVVSFLLPILFYNPKANTLVRYPLKAFSWKSRYISDIILIYPLVRDSRLRYPISVNILSLVSNRVSVL